ncbi:MAG: hypothetical protein ACR650_02120 [Methylocystis sp.]
MARREWGLPGYETVELPEEPELAGTEGWSAGQWQSDFEATLEGLKVFLKIRDPFVVLARTASSYNIIGEKIEGPGDLKQTEVEITQTLLLLNGQQTSGNPTAPASFVRYWPLLSRHLRGFIRKLPEKGKQTDAEKIVSRRARLQTLYYRNLFSREDCEEVLNGILSRIDGPSEAALGYKLSDLFGAAAHVTDLVQERLRIFGAQIRRLMSTKRRSEIVECIDFFRSAYPLADRAWRNRTDRFADLEVLRMAGFQMSELAHPWIYTLARDDLEAEFPAPIVEVLYGLAIAAGSLSDIDPEHIYLNNPIWQRPYILQTDGSLFVALPQLIFSFPFVIIEALIEGHSDLEAAYENARASYLEEAIIALVSTAMPSAAVYRGVAWDDPETGRTWENDVVAVVGNFIFIFDAKSGRIKDASRRGGTLSLRKNFKELFVEPGEQSGRLEKYLVTQQRTARLRLKATAQPIDLRLENPKVVFTFSICIEHFAALTSARHYLKVLGLVSDSTPWAPVLSLGELQMIVRFLDSEVSFVHYLTRRATLEQVLDFEGDEQDILSAYLINGLWVDKEALEGRRVVFFGSHAPVRVPKVARSDRTIVELRGILLPPMWEAVVRELYRDKDQRHRFDIINVILNQMPPALADLERRIRRFRRGVSPTEGDMAFVKFPIGSKVFVLAIYLAKKAPHEIEWRDTGRNLLGMLMPDRGGVECAAFVFVRRSRHTTFDGVSFYRYIQRPTSRP